MNLSQENNKLYNKDIVKEEVRKRKKKENEKKKEVSQKHAKSII